MPLLERRGGRYRKRGFAPLRLPLFNLPPYQPLPMLQQDFASFRGDLFCLQVGFEGVKGGYFLGGVVAQPHSCLPLYLPGNGEVMGFFQGVPDFIVPQVPPVRLVLFLSRWLPALPVQLEHLSGKGQRLPERHGLCGVGCDVPSTQ